MNEPNNGQVLSPKDNRPLAPKDSQARYTGELLLRTRPKTYRAIARELVSSNLTPFCHLSFDFGLPIADWQQKEVRYDKGA
jgi:hypothetical protein